MGGQESPGAAIRDTTRLVGRRAERAALDRFLNGVRTGRSRTLVVHGEAGTGKSTLLRYLAGRATDCRVISVVGIQAERELAFAALHQACAPVIDDISALPVPQRDALRTALGLQVGPAPDRFVLGTAVLSLLSEAAAQRPLICLVDDAQWLDRASVRVLAFAARRLAAEPVGLVFGVRALGEDLAGLPDLLIEGLREQDARALLDSVLTRPLDEQIRDQIVAETHGNPLALMELPRGLTAAHCAGGFGLPGALPGGVEGGFRRQLDELPVLTRRLLLLAAAEPTGDPALVWRAAGLLGVAADAAGPAVAAGLINFGARVRFRHPLVRSAAYQSASIEARREVHRALADATDARIDPDRRAWHRAEAAAAPDESAAADLERSAGRARARGGQSAAAAFFERAAYLTPDPAEQARRALAAAEAKYRAGASEAALNLVALAEAGTRDELALAKACLLRGQLMVASSNSAAGPPLLLEAAGRFENVDLRLARDTYLEALAAAMFVGSLANEVGMAAVAKAAQVAPPAHGGSQATDLLLDGVAALIAEGHAVGAPLVRRALRAFLDGAVTGEEALRQLFIAVCAAHYVWDDEAWHALAVWHVEAARSAGALSVLAVALNQRVFVHLHSGELAAASAIIEELRTIKEATDDALPDYAAMMLASWQGRGEGHHARQLIQTVVEEASARCEGIGLTLAHYGCSVLNNGLSRFDEAAAAAARATAFPEVIANAAWALVELIEAAVRGGQQEQAVLAFERLVSTTAPCDTPWARGVEARCRALLNEGRAAAAERAYQESIAALSAATPTGAELARTRLLYGEWLRRQRRRADAREQLRTAHAMFDAMGMEAFAARSRRELRATGETARRRTSASGPELTAQEAQIARLARDGLSNPEIGSRLFLSPRTVQYHLGKVFAKLAVTSRGQLRDVLSADPDSADTAR